MTVANQLPTLPRMSPHRHMGRFAAGLVALATIALLIPSLVASATPDTPEAPRFVSTAPDLMTPSKMNVGWAEATNLWHAQEYEKHRMIDLANMVTLAEEIDRQKAAAAERARKEAAAQAQRDRQATQTRTAAPSAGGAHGAGAAPGACAGYEGLIATHFPSDQVAKACRVMMCESGGNPNAKNTRSTASGLFQFLDSTWVSTTGTPAPARAYSPSTQIAAAAKLWRSSGWSPWVCA